MYCRTLYIGKRQLSLVNNRYRKNTNPDNAAESGYAEDPGNDERFIYNVGAIQSIAASNAQNARQKALSGFKAQTTLVLVATDIAASGIDVDDQKKKNI